MLILLSFSLNGLVRADDTGDPSLMTEPGWRSGWNLQFSLYTRHWDPEPDHNDNQQMVSFELRARDNWLGGLSVFDNSFGQSCQLLYVGKTWPLFDSPRWYAKLIGGLIHGYDKPYADKIPLNGLGVAPAVIPSVGYRHRKLIVETHFAGLAAVTVTAGMRF